MLHLLYCLLQTLLNGIPRQAFELARLKDQHEMSSLPKRSDGLLNPLVSEVHRLVTGAAEAANVSMSPAELADYHKAGILIPLHD